MDLLFDFDAPHPMSPKSRTTTPAREDFRNQDAATGSVPPRERTSHLDGQLALEVVVRLADIAVGAGARLGGRVLWAGEGRKSISTRAGTCVCVCVDSQPLR